MLFTNFSGNIDSNGQACGKGTVTWARDIIYDGSLKKGKFNGEGKIIWNANNHYSGFWKDGLMDGDNGKLISDEMKINGQFKHGSPNGIVTLKYSKGYKMNDLYEGNVVEGYMER